MCVGPQGEVYPCQSYFEPLENILEDDWDTIWNHTLCQEIRNREYAPEMCRDCPELQVCGGGCPLELKEKGSSARVPREAKACSFSKEELPVEDHS